MKDMSATTGASSDKGNAASERQRFHHKKHRNMVFCYNCERYRRGRAMCGGGYVHEHCIVPVYKEVTWFSPAGQSLCSASPNDLNQHNNCPYHQITLRFATKSLVLATKSLVFVWLRKLIRKKQNLDSG